MVQPLRRGGAGEKLIKRSVLVFCMCMAAHGDELRADFQQYYSLDIDGMGKAFSVPHAAVLCEQLPHDSRTMRSIAPNAAWGDEMALLSRIEYWAHWIAWSRSKDARHGANKPRQIEPDALGGGDQLAVDIDELDRIFKKSKDEEVMDDGPGDSGRVCEDIP